MSPNVEKGDFVDQHVEVSPSSLKDPIRVDANGDSHQKGPLEKALVRKADFLIVPLFALAYLLAFLDRNNIGNARLMGFQKELKMSSSQFYSCVMIFYGGYLVTIFPGNLSIKIIGAHRQTGGALIFFGVCVTCMSLAKGPQTVLGLRFLVGCAESLIQSGVIFLSIWYRRDELCTRIALFYSAATISGCFSSLIAYGTQKCLEGVHGRHSWQWLFIIEGSIAIGAGLLIWILMPKFPDKIKKHWLFTKEEIDFAIHRSQASNELDPKFNLGQVRAALLDPKTWFFAFIGATNATIIVSVGAFLPSIIHEFGYSTVRSQLFTVIPYSCAFVAVISIGYLSDRLHKKAILILSCLVSCVIGLIILMASMSVGVRMFGTCLLVVGVYPAAVIQMSWGPINVCGYTKRAITWGVSMIFAQGFSMLGAEFYVDPPRYLTGHGALLAFAAWGVLMTVCAYFWMRSANKTRDRILEEYHERGEVHPDMEKSYEEVYDYHIAFRYAL